MPESWGRNGFKRKKNLMRIKQHAASLSFIGKSFVNERISIFREDNQITKAPYGTTKSSRKQKKLVPIYQGETLKTNINILNCWRDSRDYLGQWFGRVPEAGRPGRKKQVPGSGPTLSSDPGLRQFLPQQKVNTPQHHAFTQDLVPCNIWWLPHSKPSSWGLTLIPWKTSRTEWSRC